MIINNSTPVAAQPLANMYKGFRIRRDRDHNTRSLKFIATLQGLRFTADTRKELYRRIDENSMLAGDMREQGFKSKGLPQDAYDESDHFLEAHEVNHIVNHYASLAGIQAEAY